MCTNLLDCRNSVGGSVAAAIVADSLSNNGHTGNSALSDTALIMDTSNSLTSSDNATDAVVAGSSNWANELLYRLHEFTLAILNDSTSEKGPTYHVYFHAANIFLLFSYLCLNTVVGTLCLRCGALIACGLFALWSYYVLRSVEALAWNIIFVIVNAIHIVILLYKLRPIRFPPEIEQLYLEVFRPLKVSRSQFRQLLKCMKEVKQLKYQEIYAQEKVTKVESVSVVLTGKFVISQQGKALHIVFPRQFLDSPEWFGVSTDDYFQVSITAIDESKILIWHRDKLRLSIMGDTFLQTVFDHIIGRDVVKKLIQVNEAVTASANGYLPTSCDADDDNFCDKSMIIVKKSGECAGIAALLSRQLQAEDNCSELAPLLNKGSFFQHDDEISKLILHTNSK